MRQLAMMLACCLLLISTAYTADTTALVVDTTKTAVAMPLVSQTFAIEPVPTPTEAFKLDLMSLIFWPILLINDAIGDPIGNIDSMKFSNEMFEIKNGSLRTKSIINIAGGDLKLSTNGNGLRLSLTFNLK
jgi:hypothetical protein